MPRIQLNPLDDYRFACEVRVRITDLNYGGHLGNDTLLSLIHEARRQFLQTLGFSEMDCGGTGLILGDTGIVYQAEAFAGDLLRIEVEATEPWRCGFRLLYRVTRPLDNRAVALVETGMICFDYESRKIVGLPTAVREICTVPGT